MGSPVGREMAQGTWEVWVVRWEDGGKGAYRVWRELEQPSADER